MIFQTTNSEPQTKSTRLTQRQFFGESIPRHDWKPGEIEGQFCVSEYNMVERAIGKELGINGAEYAICGPKSLVPMPSMCPETMMCG